MEVESYKIGETSIILETDDEGEILETTFLNKRKRNRSLREIAFDLLEKYHLSEQLLISEIYKDDPKKEKENKKILQREIESIEKELERA
ncbi:hypothetical protein IKF92_03705 [Candidatus Saccharibacteria bacterium]|nr:hypothetical protein [Candidatus Saccharibacteria bacterium]